MQELPSQVWEHFLADGDASALLTSLSLVPSYDRPLDVDYPLIHRICDVELAGQGYRVTRVVNLSDCTETLFINPTNVPDYREPGVPYRLSGSALRRWIEDEIDDPEKGPVNWSEYLCK